jgi:tRNA-binding EMAP/Myf-like protein
MEIARQGANKSDGESTEHALSMICFEDFARVRMHVGTVIAAEINQKARKPAYILKVDFGGEYGIKTTSAQIVDNYSAKSCVVAARRGSDYEEEAP